MVKQGVEKFGGYMRRKGWIDDGAGLGADAKDGKVQGRWSGVRENAGKWWGSGEKGTRLVVEVATAYAVVKLLMPVRLVLSVWATPWFARWTVVPVAGLVKKILPSL